MSYYVCNNVLLKCRQVIDFWKRIHRLVLNLFKKDIPIDDQLIVIGIKPDNSDFMIMNTLIIYAQYAIYKVYILTNFIIQQSFNLDDMQKLFHVLCDTSIQETNKLNVI